MDNLQIPVVAVTVLLMVFALYRAKPWRLFGRTNERPHDWAVHSFGQCGYWCSRVFSEEVRQESSRDIAHFKGRG